MNENSSVLSVIYGAGATVAQGANPASGIQLNLGQYTAYSCHTDLADGLRVDYVPIGCGITPTPTSTNTAEPVTPTSTEVVPTACPIQFADVLPTDTFYPFIRCLACRKVANGYPCGGPGEPCNANNDGYFRPGADITRGQIAKMVSIAAGFGEDPGPQIYTDVPLPTLLPVHQPPYE